MVQKVWACEVEAEAAEAGLVIGGDEVEHLAGVTCGEKSSSAMVTATPVQRTKPCTTSVQMTASGRR